MIIPKFVYIIKVQINYKSGISVIGNFRKFDGKMKGNEIVSLEWVADGIADGGRPIFMNISAIESIHRLKVMKRLRWVKV